MSESCFAENTATDNGGAMVVSYADINNVYFTKNKANKDGGAIYFTYSSTFDGINKVRGIFAENIAYGNGGAVFNGEGIS